jgi:lysozyme
VRRREAESRLIFDGAYEADEGSDATVRQLQQDLAALGFYRGVVDGIAGSATKAAVIAYQKSHPDLIDDGLAGPATRACIARDLTAREAAAVITGAAAGGAAASGVAAAGVGLASPWFAAMVFAAASVAVFGLILGVRSRNEIARMIRAWMRKKR